jgi:hypothetical protein
MANNARRREDHLVAAIIAFVAIVAVAAMVYIFGFGSRYAAVAAPHAGVAAAPSAASPQIRRGL